MDLPVASTTVIVSRIATISWVSCLSGRREISRRSVIRGSPVGVRVGRRRGVVASVGIIVATARRRWRVVFHRTTRGRSIASTVIVIIATRATVAVAVPVSTGAVPSRRAATVVIVHGRGVRASSRRA
jgi:hypothetical protein